MAGLLSSTLTLFVGRNPKEILGALVSGLAKEGFGTTIPTADSWQQEINEFQRALRQLVGSHPPAGEWPVFLEYVFPIIGQRIDCVILAGDVIIVLEYKGGNPKAPRAALRQAQEYALNLSDFHEESRKRRVVPLAVGAFHREIPLDEANEHHGAVVNTSNLAATILRITEIWGKQQQQINAATWNSSRYFPIPTIIEAATAIYRDHDVKDIARSKSGSGNLEITEKEISSLVRNARSDGRKLLVIVTGIPGAGKTLAGLNAVQAIQRDLNLEKDQASFLSGNGPLVSVLQEALKRSMGKGKRGVSRSIKSRIREMHRFVRDSYESSREPADRLIVFDEAQRAWTAAKNKKKFGRDISEPEMILEIMGRHKGWAVVVALVGGGQEIHGGEAGLASWGDAIQKHVNWHVVASPEALRGGPAVAGSRLFRAGVPKEVSLAESAALHLAIPKRSFESEMTAAWVNAVLDGHVEEAANLATRGTLPVWITRDLSVAKAWLRKMRQGHRRAGLIASSGAVRLRAEGVETPTFTFLGGIDYAKWFLEPEGDHRSSNQLEVALSEFEMQGLEIDLSALLWGGDLIFPGRKPVARALKGVRWETLTGSGDPQDSAGDPQTRIQNKYRVLLTRFRKGMIIFVPRGSLEDATCSSSDFDSVFDYLRACGLKSPASVSEAPLRMK